MSWSQKALDDDVLKWTRSACTSHGNPMAHCAHMRNAMCTLIHSTHAGCDVMSARAPPPQAPQQPLQRTVESRLRAWTPTIRYVPAHTHICAHVSMAHTGLPLARPTTRLRTPPLIAATQLARHGPTPWSGRWLGCGAVAASHASAEQLGQRRIHVVHVLAADGRTRGARLPGL